MQTRIDYETATTELEEEEPLPLIEQGVATGAAVRVYMRCSVDGLEEELVGVLG
jgi:hypothetical protein